MQTLAWDLISLLLMITLPGIHHPVSLLLDSDQLVL
ncbi:hypothetical protein CFP56_025506 [Quercus suber]|uniref:NADH dehydrogenase subunit 4 n=1 Tax=Quercus suber TaxID=58331 RepID=A0AAW0LZX5_QUESU